MKFFEAVPDELFSPLASPNRALYADALDVLYTTYREKLKLPIAILLDTKGPEYRIRTFRNGKITLNDGDTFTFTTRDIEGDEGIVSVRNKGHAQEMHPGDKFLVNNGLVIFEVLGVEGEDIHCRVEVGGELSNRKSMSFPNKVLMQTYLSEQDKADL